MKLHDKRTDITNAFLNRHILSGDLCKSEDLEPEPSIEEVYQKEQKWNAQSREGQVLKPLTPDQMLSELSIILAHIKAWNIKKNIRIRQESCYILCIA